MVQFLHCGDVHLGFRQYRSHERYMDFATAFRYLAETARELEVDFVLVAGDLFDRKSIDAGTLIQAKAVLEPLKKANIPVVVIEGNHDRGIAVPGNFSWLDYLNYAGYIRLLSFSGRDEKGAVILKEWQEDEQEELSPSGNYLVLGDTMIFGLGYHGAAAPQLMRDYAETFAREPGLFEGRNVILMLHGGLEGYIDRMSGAVAYNDFLPLKNHVHYLALGHIHQRYEKEGWLFNPGSLETWNVTELGKDRGFFHVTLEEGNLKDLEFFEGELWRRPFFTLKVNFQDIISYPRALAHLEDEVREQFSRLSGRKLPPAKDLSTVEPGKEGKALSGSDDQGALTLDAFTREEQRQEPLENHGSQNEEETGGVQELKPVVQLTLEGIIAFNPLDFQKSDIERIVSRLTNPVKLLIRNNTYAHSVAPELSLEQERGVLEREVVTRLIAGTREYKPVAEELGTLALELKQDLLHGTDTGTLVRRLEERRREILEKNET